MARGEKKPLGFEDVANTNPNENNDINENVNVNVDVNVEQKDESLLDALLSTDKKSKVFEKKTVTGVYLDEDILKVLNKLAKNKPRGAKSSIVNEALRKVFTDKGLL